MKAGRENNVSAVVYGTNCLQCICRPDATCMTTLVLVTQHPQPTIVDCLDIAKIMNIFSLLPLLCHC